MTALRRPRRRILTSIAVAFLAAAVGAGCARVAPLPSGSGAPPPSRSVAPTAAALDSPASPTDLPEQSPRTTATGAGAGPPFLLLSGRPAAMGLERIDGDGTRRSIPLPDPGITWLSTSLDGRALATTIDGRVFVSGPLVEDVAPTWRPVPMSGVDRSALAGPLAFGALAPDGSRAAFLAADFGSGGPFDVVVVPIPPPDATEATPAASADPTSVVRVARPAEGAAPSWFNRRVVVLARTTVDDVGALSVHPTTPGSLAEVGPTTAGSSATSSASLSIAADGGTLVASTRDGRIEVHPAEAWLAGASTTSGPVGLDPGPDGSRSFAWLALASDGDHLAIVRIDADGASVGVSIHERTVGWRQGRAVTLPKGADRAVVAWLP